MANVALGIVTVGVLTRSLGPSGFGVFSVASAYVSLFVFLTDFGLMQVGIQKMADEPESEADWLGATVVTRAAASLLAACACVVAIPLAIADGAGRELAAIMSLTVLLGMPAALTAVFQSRLRVEVTMTLLTLQSVGWFAAVVALAAADAPLADYAWALVAVSAAVAAGEVWAARRYARANLRAWRALWRPLLRAALPLGVAGVFVTIYYRIGAVLLLNIDGQSEAGLYGAGFRLLDALQILPTALMSSLFPVMAASHQRDPQRTKRLVQRALEALLAVSVPIFAGSLVVSDQLVTALFGDEFAAAGAILPVILLAFVGISFGYLGGFFVSIVDAQRIFAALAAAGVALNVALNLLLIPGSGALGASWATAATELTVALGVLAVVFRRLRFRPALSTLGRTLVATVPLVLAAAAAGSAGLVPAIAAGAVAYAAALVLLRVVSPGELLAFAGGGRG